VFRKFYILTGGNLHDEKGILPVLIIPVYLGDW